MQVRQQYHQRTNQQHHQLSLSQSPSNRDALEPQQIGNYLLISSTSFLARFKSQFPYCYLSILRNVQKQSKTIGRGTFGKVKLGIHILTQERVAIKILEKRMIQGEQDKHSVQSEISILKSVLHPNISQLYQIIETNECLYLVLEYASNGELFDFIVKKRRLNDQEACLVLAQILNALEYLHNLDISHRDLKPENLLFDHNYELKLVDFGLSKMCEDSNQQLLTCCGSPCYASPETISSQPYIGKYVDMWSCGIILFAMLCGYLPFDDDNQAALFAKIISCEYYIPTDISPEAQYLIRGLLKKDPKQRLTIPEIKNSPFYINQMQGTRVKPGIRLGIDPIYVDEAVIEQLLIYGIEPSFARQSIMSNSHNSTTATYYLLKNKYSRNPILNKRPTQPQISVHDNKQNSTKKNQITINLQNSPQNSHIPQATIVIPTLSITSPPKISNPNNSYSSNLQVNTLDTPKSQNQEYCGAHKSKTLFVGQSKKSSNPSLCTINKDSQIQQSSSKHTPTKSKTQYFEQNLSQQQGQYQNSNSKSKIQPLSATNPLQSQQGTQQIQLELNSSSEEYYNGGVLQQMRTSYANALGNYQNQILVGASGYVPSNLNNINQLINSQMQSPYSNNPIPNNSINNSGNKNKAINILSNNINTINVFNLPTSSTSISAVVSLPQPNQNKNENQLAKIDSSEQQQQQQKSNKNLSNIPQHAMKVSIQSKKTSQIDISTQKYFKAEFKKKNLFLKDHSLENTKYNDTTPSPKGVLPLSVSQEEFYQRPALLLSEESQNDNIVTKSPKNVCTSPNMNTKGLTNQVKQKQFFFMQESAKKMEVIKKIIDSVRNTKKVNNQQQTPRITPLPKQQTTQTAPDFYLKRKSVPLYLSSSKEELTQPKAKNLKNECQLHNQTQPENNNNINNGSINFNQLTYKSQKLNKTSNPSLILSGGHKIETAGVKSEREEITKKKIYLQNQIQSQPLAKSQKESVLYYPESLTSSNKKSNKLQIIFNNNNNNNYSNSQNSNSSNPISKDKTQLNSIFHFHTSNHTNSHLQTSSQHQNQSQTIKIPSSVKGSKNTSSFFSSTKKNQLIKQKSNQIKNIGSTPSGNQSHQIPQTITQQLKTASSQGQDELLNLNTNMTNATICSSSTNQKQTFLNNTTSTCADVNISAINLNDYLSDPYRRSEENDQQISEERQLSLSLHKRQNMQDLAKITQTHVPSNVNVAKSQKNNLMNFITSPDQQTNKGQQNKINKNQSNQSCSTSLQIMSGLSQHAVNSLLSKKNINLNSTDSVKVATTSNSLNPPLSTKNAHSQQQPKSPQHNNFFSESQHHLKQIKQIAQPSSLNNKLNGQKRFLFDQ